MKEDCPLRLDGNTVIIRDTISFKVDSPYLARVIEAYGADEPAQLSHDEWEQLQTALTAAQSFLVSMFNAEPNSGGYAVRIVAANNNGRGQAPAPVTPQAPVFSALADRPPGWPFKQKAPQPDDQDGKYVPPLAKLGFAASKSYRTPGRPRKDGEDAPRVPIPKAERFRKPTAQAGAWAYYAESRETQYFTYKGQQIDALNALPKDEKSMLGAFISAAAPYPAISAELQDKIGAKPGPVAERLEASLRRISEENGFSNLAREFYWGTKLGLKEIARKSPDAGQSPGSGTSFDPDLE